MEVSPNSTTEPLNMYDYMNNYFMNPYVFAILVIIILVYILTSVYLGKSSTQEMGQAQFSSGDGIVKIYGIVGIVMLVVLVALNGLQYYYGTDIFASIKNIFRGIPQVDIKVFPDLLQETQNLIQNNGRYDERGANKNSILNQGLNKNNILNQGLNQNSILNQRLNKNSISNQVSNKNSISNQVFNIPGNTYKYDDAKALCTAYGGRLATYNEVESAYNNGAEWCNYGWSDGQMALFPTQKQTYTNLQKIKGHEHDCGRPGVNGGYIANPLVKFGVNCYGNKRKINNEEQHLMEVTTAYPKTEEDLAFERSVNYWKTKLNDILVSPFNYDSWNKL